MGPIQHDILKCYDILDVRSGATVSQVRKAYVELAHVWDPVKYAGNPVLRVQAETKRAEIDAAYQALTAFLPDINRPEDACAAPVRPADAINDQPGKPLAKTPTLLLVCVIFLTAIVMGLAVFALWQGVQRVVPSAAVAAE